MERTTERAPRGITGETWYLDVEASHPDVETSHLDVETSHLEVETSHLAVEIWYLDVEGSGSPTDRAGRTSSRPCRLVV